ncbi:probable protein AGENET DOMAIN (AGD)-CONTAINING P1 at N-terminal half [Coccomyxa sp. Obi]|nr:probable protein AGENET DOMAIN (AGD)-CONTAINING P1 at N-terminal half [Coccomyxa sp. Obi]
MFIGHESSTPDLAFESQDSLHCQFLKVQGPNARGTLTFKQDGKVRSLAWSPAAACPGNACLLAVVNTGMQVKIFQPPNHLQSEWMLAFDLTAKLLSYLSSTGWKEASLEKPPGPSVSAAPLQEGSVVRLRGGGRAKKRVRSQIEERIDSHAEASTSAAATAHPLFKPGDHVEVTNDEAGLRGCWFPAVVQQTERTHVLVAYDNLDDEGTGDALQEWFPVPSVQGGVPEFTSNFKIHTAPGYLLRPQPPGDVVGRGKEWNVGDKIDIYLDGGWWEAKVVARLNDGKSFKAQVGLAEHEVDPDNTRSRLTWTSGSSNEWALCSTEGANTPGKSSGKPRKRRRKDSEAEGAVTPSAQENDGAPSTSTAVYTVPEDFDASVIKPIVTDTVSLAKNSVGHAFGQRFLELRRLVPQEELPSYKPREHLKGSDAALVERVKAEILSAHGDKLAAVGVDTKTVLLEGRRGIRMVWDPVTGEVVSTAKHVKYQQKKRQQQAPSASSQEGVSIAAASQDAPVEQGRSQAAPVEQRRSGAADATYEVPADFDAATMLPGADTTSKKLMMATFPLVFLQRWMMLRAEVPEEELEKYEKGQHLRGRDAELAVQVCAEMMSAYKEQMSGAGLTEKWLMKEGKVQIRMNVVKTRSSLVSAGTDRPPDIASLQQKINGLAQMQPETDWRSRRRRASNAAEEVSTAVYEQRLFCMSALQVAWSPLCTSQGASAWKYCVLAVGTKSGRVWLWRYRMPSSYSLADQDTVEANFALVGSFLAHAGWITAMHWAVVGGSLVLATGCSEGSVRLYTTLQSTLADLPDLLSAVTPSDEDPKAAQPQQADASGYSRPTDVDTSASAAHHGPANGSAVVTQNGQIQPTMQLMSTVMQPDLRGVTCLDLQASTDCSTGVSMLSLAAGKAVGMVVVWESGPLTKDSIPLPFMSSPPVFTGNAHGSMAVSGVSWACYLPTTQDASGSSKEAGCLLCTTGLDGTVKAWRWHAKKLVEAEPPQCLSGQPGAPPIAEGEGLQRHCRHYGIATSGNGLFAAVTRELPHLGGGETALSKRMWKGCVQLLRLHGLAAPLGPHPAAALSPLPAIVQLGVPFPACRLWDAAAAISCATTLYTQSDNGIQLTDEATSALKALLSELEQPYLLQSRTSSLSQVSEMAWRGLQLSNALRRLLQASPMQNGLENGDNGSSCLCQPGRLADGPQWEAALERNELALLQHHILERLSGPCDMQDSGIGPEGNEAILQAWIKANRQHLRPELLSLRTAASAQAEQDAVRKTELVMIGGPLHSAKTMQTNLGGCTISLQRCAASLRLCEGSPPWACLLCRRAYSSSKALLHVPTCLYCGMGLGPHLPPSFLRWPALL